MERLKPGNRAVIERAGKPWKQTMVETQDRHGYRIREGTTYSLTTGELVKGFRNDASERLVPATEERLAYLEVREFLDQGPGMSLDSVSANDVVRLAELVRKFKKLVNR